MVVVRRGRARLSTVRRAAPPGDGGSASGFGDPTSGGHHVRLSGRTGGPLRRRMRPAPRAGGRARRRAAMRMPSVRGLGPGRAPPPTSRRESPVPAGEAPLSSPNSGTPRVAWCSSASSNRRMVPYTPVVAGLPDHFLPAEPRDRLGDERRRRRRDVFERERVEQRKLRPEPAEEALVVPRDPLALRTDLVDSRTGSRAAGSGSASGPRSPAEPAPRVGSARSSTRCITPTVSGLPHAGHRPPRSRVSSGGETDVAVAVPVEVVLALLGEELQRAPVSLPRLQRPAEREVVQLGVEDAHLPPQLLRRMGVGVGHQPEAVELRHPPVHRRVRREAGLDREDVLREVPVAVVDGVESGLRAEGGEPRRPDVGGGPGTSRGPIPGRSPAGAGSRAPGSAARPSAGCRSWTGCRPPDPWIRSPGCRSGGGSCGSGRASCRWVEISRPTA